MKVSGFDYFVVDDIVNIVFLKFDFGIILVYL